MSSDYSNEYPGPRDIVRVESPVTKRNTGQAFDFLMGIKVISLLLANQDDNEKDIGIDRLRDLGRLLFFLAEQPSDVLGTLSDAFNDDDDGPDPGKERPVLTSIEATDNQVAGGAS